MRKHIETNEIDDKAKKSMVTRTVVALVLVAIILPALIVGGWFFMAVITAFLGIAVFEVIRVPHKKFGWWVYVVTYISCFSLTYWFILKANGQAYLSDPDNFVFSIDKYCGTLDISILSIAVMMGLYFLIAVADENFSVNDLFYFVGMNLLVSLGFQSIFFIRFFPVYQFTFDPNFLMGTYALNQNGLQLADNPAFNYGVSYLLFIYAALIPVFNDTFAYFFGSLFGKHRMNPRVSPKKSWEGFFAGWIAAFIMSATVGLVCAACNVPLLPTLTLDKWYWILLVSFFSPLIANLGDLSFSLIKRHYQIKDYGTILRDMGGVLDRADSILFTFISVSIFLIFIGNSWNFFA